MYITYNNKRYELTDENYVTINDIVINLDTEQIFMIDNYSQAERINRVSVLNFNNIRVLREIPIFTEHTLSSILLRSDKFLQEKRKRTIANKEKLKSIDSNVLEYISKKVTEDNGYRLT